MEPKSPVATWRENTQQGLIIWAREAEQSLNTALDVIFAQESISDEEFVTMLELFLHLSGTDDSPRLFAERVYLSPEKVGNWRKKNDLPETERRKDILRLCAHSILGKTITIMHLVYSVGAQKASSTSVVGDSLPIIVSFDPYIPLKEFPGYVGLPSRVRTALEFAHYSLLGQLLVADENELLRIDNFGQVSLGDVKNFLKNAGLWLGMGQKHSPSLADFVDAKNVSRHDRRSVDGLNLTVGDVLLEEAGYKTLSKLVLAPAESIEAIFKEHPGEFEFLKTNLAEYDLRLGMQIPELLKKVYGL